MKQFDLTEWRKDKSCKVVTRDGRNVRIVCTDSPNPKHPIYGFVEGDKGISSWRSDGSFGNSMYSYDLFFADKEDDESMLNSFLHKLEVCDLLSNKEITWIKNKLKSIKQWKPSEKQMDELEYVTRGNSYPHLTSLYQDLKNLI